MVRDDIVNVYSDAEMRGHSMFAPQLPKKREPKIEVSKFDHSSGSYKRIEVLKKDKIPKNKRVLSPDYEDGDVPEEITIINDTKLFKKNDSMIHGDPKKTKSVIKFRGGESHLENNSPFDQNMS